MAGSMMTHELELLLKVSELYWTPEMRHKIAKTVPTLYAKYTGTAVTVSAEGADASVHIEPLAPKKSPMFNANKGAPWE